MGVRAMLSFVQTAVPAMSMCVAKAAISEYRNSSHSPNGATNGCKVHNRGNGVLITHKDTTEMLSKQWSTWSVLYKIYSSGWFTFDDRLLCLKYIKVIKFFPRHVLRSSPSSLFSNSTILKRKSKLNKFINLF